MMVSDHDYDESPNVKGYCTCGATRNMHWRSGPPSGRLPAVPARSTYLDLVRRSMEDLDAARVTAQRAKAREVLRESELDELLNRVEDEYGNGVRRIIVREARAMIAEQSSSYRHFQPTLPVVTIPVAKPAPRREPHDDVPPAPLPPAGRDGLGSTTVIDVQSRPSPDVGDGADCGPDAGAPPAARSGRRTGERGAPRRRGR